MSYGVEISTDCYFVLSQYTHLTDGRTDRACALQSHGTDEFEMYHSNAITYNTALEIMFLLKVVSKFIVLCKFILVVFVDLTDCRKF